MKEEKSTLLLDVRFKVVGELTQKVVSGEITVEMALLIMSYIAQADFK